MKLVILKLLTPLTYAAALIAVYFDIFIWRP